MVWLRGGSRRLAASKQQHQRGLRGQKGVQHLTYFRPRKEGHNYGRQSTGRDWVYLRSFGVVPRPLPDKVHSRVSPSSYLRSQRPRSPVTIKTVPIHRLALWSARPLGLTGSTKASEITNHRASYRRHRRQLWRTTGRAARRRNAKARHPGWPQRSSAPRHPNHLAAVAVQGGWGVGDHGHGSPSLCRVE